MAIYGVLYFLIATGIARLLCRGSNKWFSLTTAVGICGILALSAAMPIYVTFGDSAPSKNYRQGKPRIVNLAGLLSA